MKMDPLQKWDRVIARLQRKQPGRWFVPGLSDEEVRDFLTLAIFEKPDEPAMDVAYSELASLRKRFRLVAPPTDLSEAPIRTREPDQEERLTEQEDDALRDEARVSAEASLGVPQRRWLAAMKMAANVGAFFESSDNLNLSAAARILGKNRSSATRAYEELSSLFRAERDRRR